MTWAALTASAKATASLAEALRAKAEARTLRASSIAIGFGHDGPSCHRGPFFVRRGNVKPNITETETCIDVLN